MKNVSAAYKAHLAQDLTTLSRLWKITRADGQIFAFTDHDQDIVYNGVTYLASSGFTASAISSSSDLSVDNLEVNSFLSSSSITDADLLAKKWDYATVLIQRVNYKDLSMGAEYLGRGKIGEVSTGRTAFIAELRSLMQLLQQSIGRLLLPACNADLGDSRCTVNLATYTVTGSVTSVTSNSLFTDSSRAEASQYFQSGKLTWTSGLNNGYSIEVKAFASGAFTLSEPMPYAVQVGDSYSVYKGCNKSSGAGGCSDFNNIINFRGFNLLPGLDKVLSGA